MKYATNPRMRQSVAYLPNMIIFMKVIISDQVIITVTELHSYVQSKDKHIVFIRMNKRAYSSTASERAATDSSLMETSLFDTLKELKQGKNLMKRRRLTK